MSEPQTTEYNVPSEKEVSAAIKAFKDKRKRGDRLPPNLASRYEEVVKPFHDRAWQLIQKIVNSQERTDLETYLKNADAKYRLAQSTANRYKSDSTQKQSTASHVSSGQFYKTVRVISSGQAAMLFNDPDELPVRLDPIAQSDDYTDDEGKRIANGENLYLRYCWTKEDWTSLIKRALRRNAKNSMVLLSMEWDAMRESRPERVPGWYDADGEPVEWDVKKQNHTTAAMYDADGLAIDPATFLDDRQMPTSFVFVEKVREKRNQPVLSIHDLANAFFDLSVDDIQKSPIIAIRDYPAFSELLTMAENEYYENVENLGEAQLFKDDSRIGLTTKDDRKDNAGEGTSEGTENGTFERWHIYMVAPIEKGDDKDAAKWNGKVIPKIYESVFAGPIGNIAPFEKDAKATGAVCLQLRQNPYHHREYPYYLAHSHDDEKGLLSMGYYTVLECNIEEQTVTTDQWIDNKTLAIKAPFIAEKGSVLQRDNMFSANKMLWVKQGSGRTALTKLDIPNVTQRTLEELGYLKQEADEIVGTMDVYKGQYAGARTTSTEVLTVQTQAMKPALEETKFVAVPMLRWIATKVYQLGRQFHPPAKTLCVTNGQGDVLGQTNPAMAYGDLDVKITAIDNFEADIAARQLYINFLQSGGYDRAKEYMGRDGGLYFWRMFAKRMKFENPSAVFPESRPYIEAINQAHGDYQYILLDPIGAMTNQAYLPKPGEMHDVHIAVLKPYRDRAALLVDTMDPAEKEKARAIIQAIDLYIMLHEQLKQEESQTAPGLGQGQAQRLLGPGQQGSALQASQTPGQPGEAEGDILGGLGGQMAI